MGGELVPMTRLEILEEVLPADLHGELGRELGVKDSRQQIVKRREHDCAVLVQETEVLGMGIGVTDDEVEDRASSSRRMSRGGRVATRRNSAKQ